MSCKFKSSAALAAIVSLASNALFAQAPPTVVIAFNGNSSAVPLDAWTSVGAALAIAVAAYAFFRQRRAGGFGRLSAWLVVATAAAGAVLMASRVDVIGTAHAIVGPTVVQLTTSPASIAVGSSSALLEVHNGTGAPVRINSITLQNPAQGQQIVPYEGPNCTPGLTLQVASLCYIAVGQFNPE
jgi:hypothetical protein